MRVLHLLGATEDVGGILTVLRNLQTVTTSFGCTHTVWVNRCYREIRHPALTYRFSRYLLDVLPHHGPLLLRGMAAWGELRSLLRHERFDVFHAHSRGSLPVAVGMASINRRQVLFTNHAYARRIGMYRWAARQRRMMTSVLTPSMARYYGLDLGPGGVRVISECCADSLFDRPLSPRAANGAKRPFRLVGLGNVVRWKNWHLLVDALGRLSADEIARIQFHHWGPTPQDGESPAYETELKAMIGQRGLDSVCNFHGATTDVPAALREADAFALPSTNEPCSVALIEALALGVPAIASASGGNVDIIRPGRTGLLFAADDPDNLADALRQALNNSQDMASAPEIRESVRHRSASAVASQYLELYGEMSGTGRMNESPVAVQISR